MKLILAPMDGLTDPLMRDILTQIGCLDDGQGYDWCVSEFIRVTSTLHGKQVVYRYCPEALSGWKTKAGTPVHPQFLGSDPVCLADNAARAAELGAPAIDLNFGCPAKTVNKHRGGAVLLDEPELIHQIVNAVRRAVPAQVPVSAKIRLGYADASVALEVAQAVESAGAAWLTVHARTKTQGYKPPAYWELINPLSQALSIPVIANGEVWTTSEAKLALERSGCSDLMLGRGAVTRPDLVRQLRGGAEMSFDELRPWFEYFLNNETENPKGQLGRFKQWYGMLGKGYQAAAANWSEVKKMQKKLFLLYFI